MHIDSTPDSTSPAQTESVHTEPDITLTTDEATALVSSYLQKATERLEAIRAGELAPRAAWLLADALDGALFCATQLKAGAR